VAVAILCVYLVVRQIAGIAAALAAIFLLSVNPTLLSAGPTLLSEAAFFCFVSATLAGTVLASATSGRPAYLAIALAMGAFLTRAAGITVVIAVGLWLWKRRRTRELIAFGVAFLLVVGGWFTYTSLVAPAEAGWSYATDLTGGSHVENPGLLQRLKGTLLPKAIGYVIDGLPWSLAFPTIPGTRIDNLFWLVITVVLVGAGATVLIRKGVAIVWYLLLAGALLLIWPWRVDRLLIPIFPFVLAALLIGGERLTRPLPAAVRRVALTTFTLLAGIGAIEGALLQVAEAQTCDRSKPYESAGCYNPESRSMAAASHYLRAHAAEGSVVLTVSGAAVNYLSGLLTEPPQMVAQFPPGEAGRGLRERGIRYILITGGREHEQRRLGPRLLASCHDLRLLGRFPPAAMVLETEPPRNPSEDACEPLKQLVDTPRRKPGAASK
jgi:hypothetical protein